MFQELLQKIEAVNESSSLIKYGLAADTHIWIKNKTFLDKNIALFSSLPQKKTFHYKTNKPNKMETSHFNAMVPFCFGLKQ